MKKILTTLVLSILLGLVSWGQGEHLSKKITVYGNGIAQVNKYGLDLGLGLGLEVRDAVYISIFHKHNLSYLDIKDNQYKVTGVDLMANMSPNYDWFGFGFGARLGVVEDRYTKGLYLEPYMMFFQNSTDRKKQFVHSIGILGGFFNYTLVFQVGDFRVKYRQR